MGERGPVPKRSDQRRRTNKPAKPVTKAPSKRAAKGSAPKTSATHRPDPKWHPVAKRWFSSLARSGQSAFYEPSDWAAAFVIAESISRELHPQPVVDGDGNVTMVSFPPKGASLAAWLKGMSSLLVTEGDRRRASLELQRPGAGEEASADVSELDEYRRRLQGSAG